MNTNGTNLKIMIDKSVVKSSFSKRADTYDKFASFQKEIANLLLSEIYKRDFPPKNILDIGSGTGNISINLAENYKFSKIIACDIAHGMSVFAQGKRNGQSNIHIATADTETLPYPSNSFDLIASNLMFQWVTDLSKAFAELYRVMADNGYIYLTTLAEGSLHELKDSFESACQMSYKDTSPIFQKFNNEKELKSLMTCTGFNNISLDTRDEIRFYPDVETLLRNLKYIGANPSIFARNNGMGIKGVIKEMIKIYT
ncbi:MAG TPA: methyltransferase domain-containing protein, partial [Nitrospinota bacterium]|nr:methyltransferase domain-containing protein [Nitrospinota bacterium]